MLDLSSQDVLGFRSLGALNQFEFDLFAFAECTKAVRLNGRVVDEDVTFHALEANEPKALGVVKPFDRSLGHKKCLHFHMPQFKTWCSHRATRHHRRIAHPGIDVLDLQPVRVDDVPPLAHVNDERAPIRS